ncbi:BQ5605_C006g04123 [Microbotryum silenes-dioicae]|uniref:BQ5605_C006g04123 protein n=1 Tax=Microbotryum silenes-dioicae TaxID=796604 RepID=A0A2X0MA68_9BASI|nr:BQ5605_C006g04123 [Microbotryum silenes-dioicae]
MTRRRVAVQPRCRCRLAIRETSSCKNGLRKVTLIHAKLPPRLVDRDFHAKEHVDLTFPKLEPCIESEKELLNVIVTRDDAIIDIHRQQKSERLAPNLANTTIHSTVFLNAYETVTLCQFIVRCERHEIALEPHWFRVQTERIKRCNLQAKKDY